ncbi:hypothetical protein HanXRQr2_Chr16g0758681 [Helianthus annuus]|uniref:Uncharacterized protein n=1 Tax=Helianthus annuus TaxID=4232 RepID=A0A9K3GZH8_HELAN|nr:hypothetical protein HanXRQr2_Chr16g0758681 [Helianthus annuus]KAJ0822015.1 hypothetical protein HanPSC8_Chr16g0727071 [Helianthus annuus]
MSIMVETSSRVLFIIMLVLSTFLYLQSLAGHLHPSEVVALKEIAKQLGKVDWDFSLNPCDGNPSWNTTADKNRPEFKNVVVCNCPGDDVCHIVNMNGRRSVKWTSECRTTSKRVTLKERAQERQVDKRVPNHVKKGYFEGN